MNTPVSGDWSMERMAEQFRREIRLRFEAENAGWLLEERAGLAEAKAKYEAQGQPLPDWVKEERQSFFWDIYTDSEIKIENNSVNVILPNGVAIYSEFIEMFSGTSVGWSTPSVSAVLIDGEPRVVIDLILIDYWDDERHEKWLADKATRLEWHGPVQDFGQEGMHRGPCECRDGCGACDSCGRWLGGDR